MAKPKNRIYCYECGRSKIVFESEKKALNFIKFNADIIEEENCYRPVRAYYCQCCNGWHVTSRFKTGNTKKTFTEKVIDAFENDSSAKKKFKMKYRR